MPRQNASSIQVNHQCEGFSKIEKDFTLICPMLSNKKIYKKYYGIKSNFKIISHKLKNHPFNGYRWSFESSLLALKRKPDFVYTRDIAVSFFCTLLNINNIIEIHQDLSTYSFILRFFLKWSIKKKNCQLVAISKNLGKYLSRKFSLDLNQIIVAHDAAPLINKPKIKKKFSNPLKIGYVGSLHKGKGIEIILPLAKSYQNYEFHIVGGTKKQIKAARSQSSRNVILHGHMIQEKAFALLKKFDIVLAPYSKVVRGGTAGNLADWMSPLKLFEYMAFQKPILCSNHKPLKEIAKNNQTLLFCSPSNLNDWKNKLDILVKNPKKAFKLAANARKTYEQKYTYLIRASKILNYLKSSHNFFR